MFSLTCRHNFCDLNDPYSLPRSIFLLDICQGPTSWTRIPGQDAKVFSMSSRFWNLKLELFCECTSEREFRDEITSHVFSFFFSDYKGRLEKFCITLQSVCPLTLCLNDVNTIPEWSDVQSCLIVFCFCDFSCCRFCLIFVRCFNIKIRNKRRLNLSKNRSILW